MVKVNAMKEHTLQFDRTLQKHRQLVGQLSPAQNPENVLYEDFLKFTVYKPLYASNQPLPTVLYIPGNAFVASEKAYTHFICSHLTEQSRCQVIVIKHALAPEYKFPAGFNNVNDTVKLLLSKTKNSFGFQIDKTRVAIAGYSSGGNFAALTAIQAKKMHIPIARQILISPITDLSRSSKGFEVFEEKDKAITEQFVQWFSAHYIPRDITPFNPKMSPYWAKNSALQALPPTDIIFGETDRFRGDSELYRNKLAQAGNIVHRLMWERENHGLLWNNNRVVNMVASRLAVTFGTETIPKFLETKINSQQAPMLYYFKSQQEKQKSKKHPNTTLSNYAKTLLLSAL